MHAESNGELTIGIFRRRAFWAECTRISVVKGPFRAWRVYSGTAEVFVTRGGKKRKAAEDKLREVKGNQIIQGQAAFTLNEIRKYLRVWSRKSDLFF